VNFVIRRGVPDVERLWSDLDQKLASGSLSKGEARLLKKLVKIAGFLAANPFHNSLQSHEIDAFSRRYGRKVFQSYLENQTPAAGRMFRVTTSRQAPFPAEDEKQGRRRSRRPPASFRVPVSAGDRRRRRAACGRSVTEPVLNRSRRRP
jgi:hypothetical protein